MRQFQNIFTDKTGHYLTLVGIISLLGWGLGYFGQPHILARFMAISDHKEIKKARKIAMIWVSVSLISIHICKKSFSWQKTP